MSDSTQEGKCTVTPDQQCPFKELLHRIESKLDNLHDKMFVGNGTPSYMVRLDRTETVVKVLIWLAGLIGTVTAGLATVVIKEAITKGKP